MEFRAIKISARDNVAIAVNPIPTGSIVSVLGSAEVKTNEEIPRGHKVALYPIPKGDDVIRYGEVICRATEDIRPGDWVHRHNTVSDI
jgi:altronate hydrolase